MHRKTPPERANSSDATRSRGRAVTGLLLGVAMALSGCGILGDEGDRDGRRIADTIRDSGSSIVLSVDYQPADLGDPATVIVKLHEGASKVEAVEFACTVVRPAMDSARPPVGFSVLVFDSREERLLAADDEPCEGPASSRVQTLAPSDRG